MQQVKQRTCGRTKCGTLVREHWLGMKPVLQGRKKKVLKTPELPCLELTGQHKHDSYHKQCYTERTQKQHIVPRDGSGAN